MKTSLSLLVLLMALLPEGRAQLANADNVSQDRATGQVFFENRLYRNPLRSLLEIREALPETRSYVPLFQGVPVGAYVLGDSVGYQPLTRQERQQYHRTHRLNPLRYKFDFRIHPEFVANFGNFEDPVETRTSVMLQSQLFLWRGMALNYGVLVPIVNELDGRPNKIRPAPVFLNQFLALGKHDFLSASAGLFYNDRFGYNVQYQHMNLTRPWTYGLELSLTGFYFYPQRGISYTTLKDPMALANVAYRFAPYDLTMKVSGGQYLGGDRGVRVEMIRQFTNVEISLYAIKTSNGSTMGFNLAVPIPPGKIVQGTHARLRTTEEFRWEYTYSRGFSIGDYYRVGYQLDDRLRQYHRSYLDNQWSRLKR